MEISICMMVKDEEKNIRRCLNSLKPILKNIDSELVIVDTGSKDKTVDISREYTDKIFFHEWENDFSRMRNKTISYAKGNWILIIDADEEITNCNNIIRFLKSSTNSKFQTGLLSVKNMQNLSDDSQYAMLKSPRLFRNDGEFHYEGIVHNNPIFKQPSIDLETTIVHYGYIEENEDVLNKKFIRTSNLLKSALDKEPKNIYYLFQLSVTYTSHNDYFEGYKIIKNAYELLNECKNKSKYKYVYYQMALCSLKLEEDEIAKKVCEEGLEIDSEYIDLIFYLGKAKGLLGEYEGCIQTYQRYIDLCDNYNNMNINFDVSLGMYTLGQKDESLQDMVKIYFKLGEFDEVLKFASQIKRDRYIQNVLELIISSAVSCRNINYLKNFYEEKIMSNNLIENKFFLILDKYHDNDIYKMFSLYNNDYSKLYLLRHKYNVEDSNFEQFIENISFEADFNILESYFGDVLYYKFKYCSNLSNILESVWDKNINRYLEYISKKYEDFSDVVVKHIDNNKEDMNYENLRINKILCRYILLLRKIDDYVYEWVFKYYLNIGTELVNYIYNDNFIQPEYINIYKNQEEKFLVYINIAMRNINNDKIYIQYLRKSLEVYPCMKKGIEILLKEFKERIENVNNEFENYKAQIKQKIRTFINNKDLAEATILMNEYKKIVPDDIEIYSMEVVMLICENKLERAESILKEGLTKNCEDFDLLYNLGYLYEKNGKRNESLAAYNIARINSNDKESKQLAEESLIKLGNKVKRYKVILYGEYNRCVEFQKEFDEWDIIAICSKKNTNLRAISIEKIKNYYYDFIFVIDKLSKEEIIKELNNYCTSNKIYFLEDYGVTVVEGLDYKISKLFNKNKIEGIITGLSYAEVGIKEELLNDNFVNFALSAQDIYYDFLLFKYLYEFKKIKNNLKYTIINIAYYSFDYDMTKTIAKYRIHRYINYFKNYHNNDDIIGLDINKSFYEKIITFSEYTNMNKKKENMRLTVNDSNGEYEASRNSNMNYQGTRHENSIILEEYLMFLKENNIKPIIVICPASIYYRKYFERSNKKVEFYNILNSLKKKYSFQIIDYFESNLFEDDDFGDYSHLNKKGAEKFTKALNSNINWLRKSL